MTHLGKRKLGNFQDADVHPCIKEAELSMKCLEQNHYVNEKCISYFENYKKCKEFWTMIKSKRSQNGIKPHMPTEKERKLIMAARSEGKIIYSHKFDD